MTILLLLQLLWKLITTILVGISWNLHGWAIIGVASYTDTNFRSFFNWNYTSLISSKEINSSLNTLVDISAKT